MQCTKCKGTRGMGFVSPMHCNHKGNKDTMNDNTFRYFSNSLLLALLMCTLMAAVT